MYARTCTAIALSHGEPVMYIRCYMRCAYVYTFPCARTLRHPLLRLHPYSYAYCTNLERSIPFCLLGTCACIPVPPWVACATCSHVRAHLAPLLLVCTRAWGCIFLMRHSTHAATATAAAVRRSPMAGAPHCKCHSAPEFWGNYFPTRCASGRCRDIRDQQRLLY